MKKVKEMRAEYRREELGKGVRGKHYAEFKKGSNLVLLKPEVGKNIFYESSGKRGAGVSRWGCAVCNRSNTAFSAPARKS